MLLGIIRGYINQYVNQYFENIDSSQLTGNVFYGAILHNLYLRKTILENLGLPFRVVGGKCGTLEIQYTWYRLYTEPVVVKLKDLHILLVPARSVQYDAESDKSVQQQEKVRQLEVFENMKKHMNEAHLRKSMAPALALAKGGPVAPPETTYFDEWIIPILNNIQFQIESVHIRFEDDFTKKLEPFAVGVTIQDLSVLSTDQGWNIQYLKDVVAETNYKVVKINGLTVYWNPAPTVMYKGIKDKKMLFERLSALPTSVNQDPAFKTLFGPLTFELKVQISISPDTQAIPFSKPSIRIDTSYDDFVCTVSDKQFKDILPFIDTLDILFKGLQFRKYRPNLPEAQYKGHYKEWWKFAYACVMEDITRRRNNFRWKIISEHRARCSRYLKAYYKKTVKKESNPELDRTIAVLEEELDLFNLIRIRKHVELIEDRQKRGGRGSLDPNPPPSYVGAAINWLWSWWEPVPPAGPPTITPTPMLEPEVRRRSSPDNNIFSVYELSSNDKAALKMAVGFAKNIDWVNYPVDYVDFDGNAMFNRFNVRISKVQQRNKQQTVLDAVLDNVSFRFQMRPKNDGILAELKMGRMEAYGGDFPKGSVNNLLASNAPQILTTANRGGQEYFIKFLFESSPLDSDMSDPPDHKITVEGLALQFIYNADVIQKLLDCFHVPRQGEPKIVGPIPTGKVLKSLFNFRNYPTSKVLKMMENKGKVELNICLVSPRVVIPQGGTNRRPSFFVVELGTINLVGTVIGGTICEHGGCTSLF